MQTVERTTTRVDTVVTYQVDTFRMSVPVDCPDQTVTAQVGSNMAKVIIRDRLLQVESVKPERKEVVTSTIIDSSKNVKHEANNVNKSCGFVNKLGYIAIGLLIGLILSLLYRLVHGWF